MEVSQARNAERNEILVLCPMFTVFIDRSNIFVEDHNYLRERASRQRGDHHHHPRLGKARVEISKKQ